MAGIVFRDRKYGRHIDAGFYLLSDGQQADSSEYQVGDSMLVAFADQVEKANLIKEHVPSDMVFHVGNGFIQVPCTVVKRSHTIIWKSHGAFETLSLCSLTLECDTGLWEDVLKFLVLDIRPEWIPEDK